MLDDLPDDALLLVLSHLETARDVRSLALTSRRFARLLRNEAGWSVFVRTRFPSLPLSSAGRFAWHEVAESLTWQTRCWDKRSLSFRAFLPHRHRQPARGRPVAPFHPVIDAHFDIDSREELVIWGAGENLVARRRAKRASSTTPEVAWHQHDGSQAGYAPGKDDIKALSLVHNAGGRAGALGVLVGRDNGHLHLLSASRDSFGEHLADFSPSHATVLIHGALPGTVPSQGTINSVDVRHREGLVAAAARKGIFLYHLPQERGVNVSPSQYLDLTNETGGLEHPETTVGQARWMSDNLVAVGLSASQDPLRYLTITPTGFEATAATKNVALEERFNIEGGSRLCTSSITPVDARSIMGGTSNLLLSSWRDGTTRLQDLRTPSSCDLVYCDNIDPWCEFEALLTFGTDRFIGGGVHGPTVKVFDFRWPKQYYHTDALPCSGDRPFPSPLQPFSRLPDDPGPLCLRCDPSSGRRCRWHELSRSIYYRPNGAFFISKSLPKENAYAAVWSLAKASPLSPNFYVGISGGLVEATLRSSSPSPAPDTREVETAAGIPGILDVGSGVHPTTSDTVDPHFGYPESTPAEWRAGAAAGHTVLDLEASLMETGDGLAAPQRSDSIVLPPIRGKGWGRMGPMFHECIPSSLRRLHRLDARYQSMADFKGFKDQSWFSELSESRWRLTAFGISNHRMWSG